MDDQPRSAALLALTGGGMLGRFTTAVLEGIEGLRTEAVGTLPDLQRLRGAFDLVTGTSAGALLAAGLVLGHSAQRLSALMDEHGPQIFPPIGPMRRMLSWNRAFHRTEPLALAIDEATEGRRISFGDLAAEGHHLAIPAMNESTGAPVVFSSLDTDHANVLIKDAILASSAAPIFLPAHRIGDHRYVDGGLFANAPDLVAINLIRQRWPLLDMKDISLVSLGTTMGAAGSPAPPHASGDWGLFRWGLSPPARILKLTLQGQSAHVMEVLPRLGLGEFHRLDAPLDPSPDLDDATAATRAALAQLGADLVAEIRRDGRADDLRPLLARRRWAGRG